MAYSKAFPKTSDKSVYPKWEEIELSAEEEKSVEVEAGAENIKLMAQCIEDAKKIFADKDLKDFQSDVVNVAIALFDKRASHNIYWKENKAKDKFKEQDK